MNPKHERDESLWLMVVSPTVWAAHFLGSYVTAAIWCAKFAQADRSADWVRLAVVVYTIVALLLIGYVARLGYVQYRSRSQVGGALDAGDAEDRTSFLGFATLLLSGLSAVATIFVALVIAFIGSCN